MKDDKNTPQLIAKIGTLENRLSSIAGYEVRLRNCIDRLVGPEPVSEEQPDQDHPISVYEKLDQMNRVAEELATCLADQTDRLVLALGSD